MQPQVRRVNEEFVSLISDFAAGEVVAYKAR